MVSDIQTDVSVVGKKITGTLNYLDEGPIADYWGDGYFIALKFTDIGDDIVSLRVGLDPSYGTGLLEAIDDPDKNGVFKINNLNQKFKVVQSNGTISDVQTFDMSDLVLAPKVNS